MKNNKKGFTLIELLAVIVILAILVMLAIPAVTRYLVSARKNTFADNALRAVEAVRNDVVTAGMGKESILTGAQGRECNGTTCTYDLDDINSLLENKLTTSSFGGTFNATDGACVSIVVTYTAASNSNAESASYTMTMVDSSKYGFVGKDISEITASNVLEQQTCPTTNP